MQKIGMGWYFCTMCGSCKTMAPILILFKNGKILLDQTGVINTLGLIAIFKKLTT